MKICENGIYREMTKEELQEMQEQEIQEETTPTTEERLSALEDALLSMMEM